MSWKTNAIKLMTAFQLLALRPSAMAADDMGGETLSSNPITQVDNLTKQSAEVDDLLASGKIKIVDEKSKQLPEKLTNGVKQAIQDILDTPETRSMFLTRLEKDSVNVCLSKSPDTKPHYEYKNKTAYIAIGLREAECYLDIESGRMIPFTAHGDVVHELLHFAKSGTDKEEKEEKEESAMWDMSHDALEEESVVDLTDIVMKKYGVPARGSYILIGPTVKLQKEYGFFAPGQTFEDMIGGKLDRLPSMKQVAPNLFADYIDSIAYLMSGQKELDVHLKEACLSYERYLEKHGNAKEKADYDKYVTTKIPVHLESLKDREGKFDGEIPSYYHLNEAALKFKEMKVKLLENLPAHHMPVGSAQLPIIKTTIQERSL